MVTCANFPNKTHMTHASCAGRRRVAVRPHSVPQEGCVLHANPRSLLLVSLIGVAACDRNSPTAAPPPPPASTPAPIPQSMVVPASLCVAMRRLHAAQFALLASGPAVFPADYTPVERLDPFCTSIG